MLNRPIDVTDEDYQGWKKEALEYDPCLSDGLIELFCAGEYLSRETRKLGADDDTAKGLCFTLGRLCWPSCYDVWGMAKNLIEEYSKKDQSEEGK